MRSKTIARIFLLNCLVLSCLAQIDNTPFTYLGGPNFCLANYGYSVPAFCTTPQELPLGSFPVPPVGGFYIDPNFGAKVHLITDGTGNTVHQYSSPSAFSATGKYILYGLTTGFPRIIQVADNSVVVPDLTGILDPWSALWSSQDDVLYIIGPSSARTQILKYQVSTRQKTVLVDYATDSHHFTGITFGGTGDLSADNWAAFWAENEHQVCAVDLNVVRTYCTDYTAPNPNNRVGWHNIDYVMITQGKDVDTNKRYVLLMAVPAMGVYSVNEQTGVLDFEFRGPETPAGLMGGDNIGVGNKDGVCDPGETCLASPHAAVFQDGGRQYLFMDVGVDTPCEDRLSSLQIAKGLNMYAPVESGGGRKDFFTLFKCGLTWSSMHFGCSRSVSGTCVVSVETPEPNLPNQIRDGKSPFDSELIVTRGNGTEARRVAMHRSVLTGYWDTPRACISPDGGMILWDSNFGNPSTHRIAIAETGFAPTPFSGGCTYSLSSNSLNVPSAGSSGTITVTPSASNCAAPTASSNVPWATAAVSGNVVSWSVSANGNPLARSGSLSIAGQTVAISQAGSLGTVTMTVFPTALSLGAGSSPSAPQSVSLTFQGGPAPSWTATSNQANIKVSPSSGVGNATLQVTATAGPAGIITINAVGVTNSPQAIDVQVTSPPVAAPFGSFDTPLNNTSGVSAAIAVTGWALDAIGVTKVDIWREPIGSEPQGLAYIGDAIFITGARPDVARAFPDYPFSTRAGWGYLLLTNFLPNANGARGSANGTYKLHALAHNRAGAVVDLGTRTINVDNADATLPFGNIDTPEQGGTVFGNAYVNFGWALTPMPAQIPNDGSTITVNVDGVTLGHPNYNQFRGDIATLFPGYANSNGAIGFFYVDTTRLTNGLHSINWGVWDNKVRGNGVGSRFFTVINVGGEAGPAESAPASTDSPVTTEDPQTVAPLRPAKSDPREEMSMDVEEMDRIELPLGAAAGYSVDNGDRQPLPIGSTLKDGTFYWQLAPVYLGEYNLAFERPGARPVHLRVIVHPKKYSEGEAKVIQ